MAEWEMAMQSMKGMMMKGMMMKGMMMMKGGKGFPGKGAPGGKKGGSAGPINKKKLFVGGLPKQPSEDAVNEFFSSFGTVADLKIVNDDQGICKGYCFVTYEDEESAQRVVDNGENNIIDGKWVDCKISDPSSSGGGGSQQAAKPGDWYCPMCGDLVFAKRTSCNMCGYSGMGGMPVTAEKAGKPGDWVCPSCGDLVFSYRDACNKCGAERTAGVKRVGAKPGDWSCPSCGDLVFASKSACKMCGTPKPEGIEDTGRSDRYSPY